MGAKEPQALAWGEATLKYHPGWILALTYRLDQAWEQRLVGSLTGAVASQSVTEAPKGPLRRDGNPPFECIGRRGLDCEADKPSRGESRAK